MKINTSTQSETSEILNIHSKAFGGQKGRTIAELVRDMLGDVTAEPTLSMTAIENETPVGHILFSNVNITDSAGPVVARILAPLAILPAHQNKGIGVELINEGLKRLKNDGVDLVFVLGHPDYYPRCGFIPAGVQGFEAPYHIPDEHAGAWMVKELQPGIIKKASGKVQCCDVLNQPEHWRE